MMETADAYIAVGLPADYEALTADGQRLARIAAVSRRGSPEELVTAWRLFRNLYLDPLPPGVFYKNYVPDAPVHSEMIASLARWRLNVWSIPRGFAKSTRAMELLLLLAYTAPHYRMRYCRATQSLSREVLTLLKEQMENNEYLLADFGRMKPPRGQKSWSYDRLWLNNGAEIGAVATAMKQRGGRPDLYILDDPEYDQKKTLSTRVMRENLETFLFQIVLPMLDPHASIWWLGTIISKRTLLFDCFHGEDNRFESWNRELRGSETTDGTSRRFLWANKMGEAETEARIREMGMSRFSAEYLNRPVSEADRLLKFNDTYSWYSMDKLVEGNPLTSEQPVTYYNPPAPKTGGEPQKVVTPFGPWVSKMYRVLLADPIKGPPSPSSDYQAIIVAGFTRPADVLVVLDCLQGKWPEARFMERIWALACKWQVRLLGLEANSTQVHFVERFRAQWADDALRSGYMPRILPITNTDDKAARISGALEWRFEYHRIKFPAHLKALPHWRELLFQAENFTMDIEGSLSNDDLLDALSFGQQVARTPVGYRNVTPKPERTDVAAQILAGERFVEGTDFPLGLCIPLDKMSDEVLAKQRRLVYGNTERLTEEQLQGRGMLVTDGF